MVGRHDIEMTMTVFEYGENRSHATLNREKALELREKLDEMMKIAQDSLSSVY